MKKWLRIPIVLLLLGGGFLFLVQNPQTTVSQKILPVFGIQTQFPLRSGIDLTTCKSYFDGCNTCSVKDGKPEACTLMYCETPSTPRCVDNEMPATPSDASTTGTTSSTTMANPASVNCEKNGGTLEILDGTGGQYGMCHLPDGTSCEERAYMRGECGQKNTSTKIPSNNDGGNKACTMEYAPVCARVHIQCIKAPCEPIEQTFGNKCTMEANSLAEFLHNGECTK